MVLASKMKVILTTFILGLACITLLAEQKEASVPTIHLFSDGKDDEEGLKITLQQTEYAGNTTEKVEFKVLIVNRLLEEVFVEVTRLDEAAISISADDGMMATGGSGAFWPDNVRLLKRLHASTISQDGKRSSCGCSMVTVTQSAEVNLSHWIGTTGNLSFRVTGFYRSSGKEFSEKIDLSFSIKEPTKSEQGGTVQPATRHESKSEGGDKPQPESEGRSQ